MRGTPKGKGARPGQQQYRFWVRLELRAVGIEAVRAVAYGTSTEEAEANLRRALASPTLRITVREEGE